MHAFRKRCLTALVVAMPLMLGGCERTDEVEALRDRSIARGAEALQEYGCGTCHRIPGIVGAIGTVGPPLERIAGRVYLAGHIPNSPGNLAEWIKAPQRYVPTTAMPDLGVSHADAIAMASFLSAAP